MLTNWFLIKLVINSFPQHIDKIRRFVFKNPKKFLSNIYEIKTAIDTFPQSANILQKQSVELINIASAPKEKIRATVEKVHAAVMGDLSCHEIGKNARIIAQGGRDNREGKEFMFFKNLPDSIGIKIAALTGTLGIHTEEEAEQIAQASYS